MNNEDRAHLETIIENIARMVAIGLSKDLSVTVHEVLEQFIPYFLQCTAEEVALLWPP